MQRLRDHVELHCNPIDRPVTRQELIAGVRDVDGLIPMVTDRIDAAAMDASPRLKVIANFGVGFNNIDIAAATARGIVVTNTPDVLTATTADLAWALLMALSRRVVEGDQLARSGEWEGWGPTQLLGADITSAALGLIGLGRIGRAMASRAKGFEMNVRYWNRTRMSEDEERALGVTYGSMDEVLAHSDFVSLHVAMTDETYHLIGAEQFARMKSTAVLINTARGAVVDEKALVAALQSAQIAGAGLDVFENEPQIEPELRSMSNVVLLPHLGSATIGTRTKMGHMAIDNLLAAHAGERPPNLVNSEIFDEA